MMDLGLLEEGPAWGEVMGEERILLSGWNWGTQGFDTKYRPPDPTSHCYTEGLGKMGVTGPWQNPHRCWHFWGWKFGPSVIFPFWTELSGDTRVTNVLLLSTFSIGFQAYWVEIFIYTNNTIPLRNSKHFRNCNQICKIRQSKA